MLDEYPDVLTVADIQKILRIGRCTAYELIHTPDFPTKKVGRAIRIPKMLFIEWLENCWQNTDRQQHLKLVKKRA